MYICHNIVFNMKHKKRNIRKTFLRFLKDNGAYPMYRKVADFKSFKEYCEKTYPDALLDNTPIKTGECNNGETSKYLKSLTKRWIAYYKIIPFKEEIINKFEMFLKKRGIYELYNSCIDPMYIQKMIFYNNRLYNANTIELTENPTSWKDINPEMYLTKTFDRTFTIKTKDFWEKIDEKWQEELKQIYKHNKVK